MLKPAGNSQQIYSVTKLNRLARRILEGEIGNIWLSAEISNFTAASSGHWYFTLKDPKAQIRAAMFRGANSRVKYRPKEGDKVLVRANISLYEPRGDYQLIVEHIELDGDGALKAEFEALKNRLYAEGLFDADRKRPLPEKISTVGVVTSATGAALHDILTVLKRRNPAIQVIVYPAQVQGEAAPLQLIKAIETANERAEVDILLVSRGGGSIEDLWCFNDELLARTIAESQIPTVSAVGHEVDVTIADFVADVRAATPSAAAELVSGDIKQQSIRLQHLTRALQQSFTRLLKVAEHRTKTLYQRLSSNHPQTQLNQQAQRLDSLQMRLQQSTKRLLNQRAQVLEFDFRRLKSKDPKNLIEKHTQSILQFTNRLNIAMQNNLSASQRRLQGNAQLLQSVSPLATLARGYSITLKDDTVVQSTSQLTEGEQLITKVSDGEIHSTVNKLFHKNEIDN